MKIFGQDLAATASMVGRKQALIIASASGCSALHLPASLGNECNSKAGIAVREHHSSTTRRSLLGTAQNTAAAAAAALAVAAGIPLAAVAQQPPAPKEGNCVDCLGVTDDLFAPCPDAPICVSTQDDKPYSFIPPWSYEVSTSQAKDLIAAYVASMPQAKIVSDTERYLRAEVVSAAGTALDDVEFYLTPGDTTVQFRAARRGGLFDFGANRRRMEQMRIALNFEPLPVLRNRSRTFIFGESAFDTFGSSGTTSDMVPEEMSTRELYGTSRADLSDFEDNSSSSNSSFGKRLAEFFFEQSDDRVRSK